MKKIFQLIVVLLSSITFAQAPNKMSYQAVIRDASNNLITNTNVGVRISILQGSSSGTAVYQENHTSTSNINGLVSLEIGDGTVVSGTFSSIDWSSGDYYIKTETDPTGGSNYTISGTSQLLSVPYALYAASAGTGNSSSWTIDGNNQYNALSGKVGIGESNPTNKLEVVSENEISNTIFAYNDNQTAGTSWNLNTNYSAVAGHGANKPYQAGIYGYVNGSSNNTAGVLGAYDASLWGGLAYTDNDGNQYGLYSNQDAFVNGITKTTRFQMTDGANDGYILQSDADGNGSWISTSSLTLTENDPKVGNLTNSYLPKWDNTSLTNSLLYDDGTAVSIGTTDYNFGNNFSYSRLTLASEDSGNSDFNLVLVEDTSYAPYLDFGKARGTFASKTSVLNNDQVFTLTGNAYNGNSFTEAVEIYGNIDGTPSTTSTPGRIVFATTTEGSTNTSEKMRITNSGNVGIGTSSPTEKLEVNGTIKTTNLQITSGATNGYVLQSDTSGNGVWVNPTSLSNGNWTSSGSDQYSALTGNVGIGTTTPLNKLDIQGSASTTANIQSNASSAFVSTASPSGQEASLVLKNNNSGTLTNRWAFGKSTTSESGSNSGSDYFINRYSDIGSYLGQPLSINRANGTTTIGNDAPSSTESTLKVNGSVAYKTLLITSSSNATTLNGDDNYIIYSGTITGNSITLPTASSYTGRVYTVVNHSSAAIAISSYTISNGTTSTSIAAGTTVQLISSGVNWHKIN